MKMETVIRSPVDGVVRRVVHGKGVSCSSLLFLLLLLVVGCVGRGNDMLTLDRICARLGRRWLSSRRRRPRRASRRVVVVEGAGGESDGRVEEKEGCADYALIEMNTYLPTYQTNQTSVLSIVVMIIA
jgi:hypothetical protein